MIYYPSAKSQSMQVVTLAAYNYGQERTYWTGFNVGLSAPYLTWSVSLPLGYWPNVNTKVDPLSLSPLLTDSMKTGPQGFMGDHSCRHFHADGILLPQSGIYPVFTSPTTQGSRPLNPKPTDLSFSWVQTLRNDYGTMSAGQSTAFDLIPGFKDKYDVAILSHVEDLNGTSPSKNDIFQFNADFVDVSTLKRTNLAWSMIIRSQAVRRTFRRHNNQFYCVASSVYVTERFLVHYFPAAGVTTYYKYIDFSRLYDNMSIPNGNYGAWLSNWNAKNDNCKYRSFDDTYDALVAGDTQVLDAYSSEVWRDPANSKLIDDAVNLPVVFKGAWTTVNHTNARYTDRTIVIPAVSADSIQSTLIWVNNNKYLMSDDLNPSALDHGQCAQDLADACHVVDINSLALIQDLKRTKEDIFSVRDEIMNLTSGLTTKNPLKILKSVSSLFLSYKYGGRLTFQDLTKLVSGIKSQLSGVSRGNRNGYTVVRTRRNIPIPAPNGFGVVRRSMCYKMYFRPSSNDIKRAIQKLEDWDIYPTFENIWDLVPLSFVVDWFVNVGDLFKALDDNNYLSLLDVGGFVWSVKDEFSLPGTTTFGTAILVSGRITCYKRYLTKHVPFISSSLSFSDNYNQNYLEGASLIVQRY